MRALEGLRHDLGVRHRIPGGRITANRGTAVLVLNTLTVWCHQGERFTWSLGRDERNQPVIAKAPAGEPEQAADLVAARYRQLLGYQPPYGRAS
ncbi:hypothetical protein [Microbispora sp. NBC_01389]|uniref:hypothetical protein n=1 Tax=Microbispora sp. NBC_01389 TaxID=2903584 RepID=UPI00324B2D0B